MTLTMFQVILRRFRCFNSVHKLEYYSTQYRQYITAPAREKIWTVLGPKHWEDSGKKALIVRALYGLKSSGAAFRVNMCECMRSLGYKSCLADPDLWMRPQNVGNFKYYSYILCYVDDIVVVHHDARPTYTGYDQ